MKVRPREVAIREAWRVFDAPVPDWVRQLAVDNIIDLDSYTAAVAVLPTWNLGDTRREPLFARVGDWLVDSGPDSPPAVYSDAKFRETFEEVR